MRAVFSKTVSAALADAAARARAEGAGWVRSEHVLDSLLARSESPVSATVLATGAPMLVCAEEPEDPDPYPRRSRRTLSPHLRTVLKIAREQAQRQHAELVEARHVLYGLVFAKDSTAARRLAACGIDGRWIRDRAAALAALPPDLPPDIVHRATHIAEPDPPTPQFARVSWR